MSAQPVVRSTGVLRKLLKVAGFLVLALVLGFAALATLGWWMQSRDAAARAAATWTQDCRKVGEGDAQITVCTDVANGSAATTSSAD